MRGNKMIVSSERDRKGAMKLCDAAYLPSCDEISRETCEYITVRVDREGRKDPREVLAVCD